MVKDDQPDLSGHFQVTNVNSIAAERWDSTCVESPSLRFEVARCGDLASFYANTFDKNAAQPSFKIDRSWKFDKNPARAHARGHDFPTPSMLQNRIPPRSLWGSAPTRESQSSTQRRLTNCDQQTIRVRDRALQISVKRRDATTIETVRKQPQGAS